MKPYHYILLTVGLALVSNIVDSMGNMLLTFSHLRSDDYMSINAQIWNLLLNLAVITYPVVILWLSFPQHRPPLGWKENSLTLVYSLMAILIAISLSVATHPFNEYYLLYKYYTAKTHEPFSTLYGGQVVYTLSSILFVTLVPIVEELIFRGYLTERLIQSTSLAKTFFTQLLCFVLFQVSTSGNITESIVIGTACGAVYMTTRNVYLSIMFNLVYTISTKLITTRTADEFIYDNLLGSAYWIIVAFSMGIITLLIMKGKRLTDTENS